MAAIGLFATTLSLVEAAIKYFDIFKDKYEAYKKSPALIKALRTRTVRIKRTLEAQQENFEHSSEWSDVLNRVCQEFHSLNEELKEARRSLCAKSKFEKWFSSMKPKAVFESITTQLKFLEFQLDQVRLLFEVREELSSQIAGNQDLLRKMMDDVKLLMHMATRLLAALLSQPRPYRIDDKWQKQIQLYEYPKFGSQLCNKVALPCSPEKALTELVPNWLHELSVRDDKSEKNQKLVKCWYKFLDVWSRNKFDIDAERALSPADIEIDITGEKGPDISSNPGSDIEHSIGDEIVIAESFSAPSPVRAPDPVQATKNWEPVDSPSPIRTPDPPLNRSQKWDYADHLPSPDQYEDYASPASTSEPVRPCDSSHFVDNPDYEKHVRFNTGASDRREEHRLRNRQGSFNWADSPEEDKSSPYRPRKHRSNFNSFEDNSFDRHRPTNGHRNFRTADKSYEDTREHQILRNGRSNFSLAESYEEEGREVQRPRSVHFSDNPEEVIDETHRSMNRRRRSKSNAQNGW